MPEAKGCADILDIYLIINGSFYHFLLFLPLNQPLSPEGGFVVGFGGAGCWKGCGGVLVLNVETKDNWDNETSDGWGLTGETGRWRWDEDGRVAGPWDDETRDWRLPRGEARGEDGRISRIDGTQLRNEAWDEDEDGRVAGVWEYGRGIGLRAILLLGAWTLSRPTGVTRAKRLGSWLIWRPPEAGAGAGL